MKRINYIGLDMDHTLVRYNSANFEGLAHQLMIERLISDLNYPTAIKKSRFSYDYAIRGLVIDRNNGNLLKLSRFGAIRMSRHGVEKMEYGLQKKLYKSIYIDLSDPEYDSVDTSFSIAYAALLAQLVDFKDNDTDCADLPDYVQIAQDVTKALDSIHRDGSIKKIVAENLETYIIPDKEVVDGLKRYLKHGKKIFIVTNSDFAYTKLLLNYAINPFLDGETWQDIFEFVITSAQKPRFFYDNLKFLKIDPETGAMKEIGTEKVSPGIYYGGCANKFTQDLDLNPDEILYVGDHIYGDILRLKKDCAWRTALVVEELEDEVAKNQEARPISEQIEQLMEQKVPIEREIDELISKRIENETDEHNQKIDELIKAVTEIDSKISPLIKKFNQVYNHYWGEVMRTGIEESYFAYQVERFACIYTSRLSNLLNLSPRTYFRSSKRLMPHELI